MPFIKNKYALIAAVGILCYALLNWYCSTKLSVNGDEQKYFAYGVNMIKGHPQKELQEGVPVFNSQLPVTALNAIPRAIQQVFDPGLTRDAATAQTDIRNGRIFSILSALLLALYVWTWSSQLYGPKAGLFSLLLYLLCPNIMAHSEMVSTDVYSFLVCTATCYHCWRYIVTGNRWQLLLVAVLLGAGQLTKQSLLLLYPVIALFLTVRALEPGLPAGKRLFRLIREQALILLVSLLIINAGFLFYHTGRSLNEYHFASRSFNGLRASLPKLGNIPIPLPEPYIAGFDAVSYNVETGPGIDGKSSYGSMYFMGERMEGQRIWYYYLVTCLYKFPLPFLLFFFTALGIMLFRKRARSWKTPEFYLLFPALFIFLCFSGLNTMYLGIKNILMLFPLLFIFCGYLFTVIEERYKKWGRVAIASLLLWQCISVGAFFPHFFPYTNELIPDKTKAYKVFGDDNIYFQEGWDLAKAYLARHPEIQFEPAQPVHGMVMVSLDAYYDWWHTGKMGWLREMGLEPVGAFNSAYLLFRVK